MINDLSGPSVGSHAPCVEGFRNYLKFTNDNGGVNGRKIETNIIDDQSKVDKALAGFQKLIEDGTFAIALQGGSSQYAALDPLIKDEEMPVFGPMQTMKLQSDNPYTYNVNLGYLDQGKIFIKRVLDTYKGTGKPKIAYWALDVSSAKELGGSLKTAAQAAGIDVVQEELMPGTINEMAAQMIRLKQLGANYVVFLATPGMFTTYLRDAYRFGASDIPILAVYSGVNTVIPETAGKEASKNYFGMQSFTPVTGEGAGVAEMRQFAEKNNVDTQVVSNLIYVQGWTTAKLFVEALKRAGKNLTRESFIKAVESINNFETGGLSPKVTFCPNDHDGISSARFYQYDFEAKKIIPVSGYYSAD